MLLEKKSVYWNDNDGNIYLVLTTRQALVTLLHELIWCLQTLDDVSTIIIPVLQVRKLR